jgi:hypothetical protein
VLVLQAIVDLSSTFANKHSIDATIPPAGRTWRALGFEHDSADSFSSYLTNVLQETTLRCHRNDQRWVSMLLPDIYHGPLTTDKTRGALKGDITIFLALLALSMPASQLATYLPSMFQDSSWQEHSFEHGCESLHF